MSSSDRRAPTDPADADAATAVVKTRAGYVRGEHRDGVYGFKGVRYGATTATRRFLAPAPPVPWDGIKLTDRYAAWAPQMRTKRAPDVETAASWQVDFTESEDCLFLNVWIPGLPDGRGRPVLVWLHGGGFQASGTSSPYADGTRLAQRGDVVVVTVGHRLNAFGYLYLAHLDPELADSGNAGNLDLVLALEWVRDNIAQFGGDPGNVTIFGQSGGGGKVSSLMAMPAAAGLFHKAIIQSGTMLKAVSTREAEQNTAKVLGALDFSPSEVDKLRSLPTEQIKAVLATSSARFGPVKDGGALPRDPFDPDAPAISKDIRLLVGTTKDEMTRIVGAAYDSIAQLSWEELPAQLAGALDGTNIPVNFDPVAPDKIGTVPGHLAKAARVVAELRRISPDLTPGRVYLTALTEYGFRRQAIRQAERMAAFGARSAFMYLLAWETPVSGGKFGSPHSLDLGLMFDNVERSRSLVGPGPEPHKMADTMSDAWIQFARSADPGWPAYSVYDRATMVFDIASHVVSDPRRRERLLFASGNDPEQ
jgi:para-nitrobenzyl esterase